MEQLYDGQKNYSSMSIQVLVEGIRSLEWSCSDVMQHFLFKAKLAHQNLNCVTQFLEESAVKAATHLDNQLAQGVQFSIDEFPLLGLPISIKDTIDVEGYATVAGYKSRLNKLAVEDSHIVQVLRSCGAIPFIKTNVPQFCSSAESSNPVYGTTLNPNNPLYTPGGSSSGEAALIKEGGSLIGIGSDLSGSLRIPAHYCGIYSFKPTSTRFPSLGHINLTPGQENLALSLGPMANSLEDLQHLFKSVLLKEPWKFTTEMTPIPYNSFRLDRKLKVGYLVSDEMFPATPACRRAVLETVDALKAEGHSCKEVTFDNIKDLNLMCFNLSLSDSWKGVRRQLTDEGIDKTITMTAKTVTLPYFVKYLGALVTKYIFGQTYLHDVITQIGALSVDGLFQVQHQRQILKDNLMQVWKEEDLDTLLLPISSIPAFELGKFYKASPSFSYTTMFNAFDMPAGVLPVTKVDPSLDRIDNVKKWIDQNLKPDKLKLGTWVQQDLYSLYNADEMVNLPVGVQVACKRYEDEKCLYVMDIVDKCLKNKPQ